MYGYIYLTTNLVNGKKYVGQHRSSTFDPNYKGSGKLIKLAFEKYGWSNFSVEILQECDSLEELNQAEIDEIRSRNAVESREYYNFAGGGQGWSSSLWTNPESRQRMIDQFTGEGNPFYGKSHSKETKRKISDTKSNPSEEIRQKISQSILVKYQDPSYSPRLGKHHSEETLKVMGRKSSEFHKGRVVVWKDDTSKRILQDEVQNHLDEGWRLGLHPDVVSKITEKSKGRKQNSEVIARRVQSLKGKVYNVTCKNCGVLFTSHSSATRYCSNCR